MNISTPVTVVFVNALMPTIASSTGCDANKVVPEDAVIPFAAPLVACAVRSSALEVAIPLHSETLSTQFALAESANVGFAVTTRSLQ